MRDMLFFDIEADGFYNEWDHPATRIDCYVQLRESTGEFSTVSSRDEVPDIRGNDTVVGHNIIDYDLRMLAKFWGWGYQLTPDQLRGATVKFVDTLVLSKLVDPELTHPEGYAQAWKPAYEGQSLPGPHSLDCWGFRLGIKKPSLVYGENLGNVNVEVSVAQATADIEITRALYYHLKDKVKALGVNLVQPLCIEQAVRHIISEGATRGVVFDTELAEECLLDLDQRMAALAAEVDPQLPSRRLPKSKVKLPPKGRLKAGPRNTRVPHANAIKYFGDLLVEVGGQWVVQVPGEESVPVQDWPADRALVTVEPTSISDSKDIKEWLIDVHGWEPMLWNYKKDSKGKTIKLQKTTPKFHEQGRLCGNLERLGDKIDIVKSIVLYLSYRNRRSVIKSKSNQTGWLNHPRLGVDGRLPADADTIGTPTFRHKHRVVANVPRVSSVYGSEMRALFRVPDGYSLVGCDASGLEDRCKGHYTYPYDNGEYAAKLLNPNYKVHEENAAIWGLPVQVCKSGQYALQYGCQPPTLAATLKVDLGTAEAWWSDWWSRNPALSALKERVETVWARYDQKYLPGLDGRLIPTRSKHALLNTLFQSAGALLMKYAMVIFWLNARRLGIPAWLIIQYHDEFQIMVKEGHEHQVGGLLEYSIKKAGEKLNFRVPVLSEYKVGKTWADTH